MVDYKLLMELASECGYPYPVHQLIEELAMCDVPMSDAVIKLGIACDILMPGYHNDWSKEMGL